MFPHAFTAARPARSVPPFGARLAMTPRDRSDEIDRLVERRARDPRTHTFAALADLYRQTGELDRALEVVQDGLRHHPHFLNARLVHAKLLRELGRDEDAAAAFRQVLEIDSENRIARSALTEIVEGVAETGSEGSSIAVVDERPRRARWLARLDDEWRNGTSEEAEDPSAAREAPEPDVEPPVESEGNPQLATELGPEAEGPAEREVEPESSAEPEDAPTDDVAPAPDDGGSGGGDLETATLAQLYVSQGLIDQAIGIYERLLARDPYNARLAASLEDVRQEGRAGAGSSPPAQRARPPIPRVDPNPEGDAPADRAFDRPRRRADDAVPVPESPEVAEPVETTADPDGPSMREFLRDLVDGHAPVDPDGGDVDWPAWLRDLGTRG